MCGLGPGRVVRKQALEHVRGGLTAGLMNLSHAPRICASSSHHALSGYGFGIGPLDQSVVNDQASQQAKADEGDGRIVRRSRHLQADNPVYSSAVVASVHKLSSALSA